MTAPEAQVNRRRWDTSAKGSHPCAPPGGEAPHGIDRLHAPGPGAGGRHRPPRKGPRRTARPGRRRRPRRTGREPQALRDPRPLGPGHGLRHRPAGRHRRHRVRDLLGPAAGPARLSADPGRRGGGLAHLDRRPRRGPLPRGGLQRTRHPGEPPPGPGRAHLRPAPARLERRPRDARRPLRRLRRGRPTEAARLVAIDGSVSHDGEGIYGGRRSRRASRPRWRERPPSPWSPPPWP